MRETEREIVNEYKIDAYILAEVKVDLFRFIMLYLEKRVRLFIATNRNIAGQFKSQIIMVILKTI